MSIRSPAESLDQEAVEHAVGSALSWITELPEADLISWQKIFQALSDDAHPCGDTCRRVLRNILTGEGEAASQLEILTLAWIMKSGGWDTIL